MFLYPEHSQVERILPKNKIYGHAQPNRATRQRFVDQVDQIVWRYKLAPETIHLPAKAGAKEIQVFEIALKSGGAAGRRTAHHRSVYSVATR